MNTCSGKLDFPLIIEIKCAHYRKKHAYCEVCYTCAVCDEVFLRKNYSSSEHVSSDSRDRGDSRDQCFKKFHPKVRNHGEVPY